MNFEKKLLISTLAMLSVFTMSAFSACGLFSGDSSSTSASETSSVPSSEEQADSSSDETSDSSSDETSSSELPAEVWTEVTYTFVNADESFTFVRTQKAGTTLEYEYSAVEYSNVWYTSSALEGTATVAQGEQMTVYTPFNDIAVYALFRSEGKTIADEETSLREGLILRAAPDRQGYVFLGWEREGQTYAENKAFDLEGVAKDATLIFDAKWTPEQYTVNYSVDGVVTSVTQTYGSSVAEAPEKTGYTFTGWYDGTTLVETIVGEVTLTAGWEAYSYAVTFDLGGYTGKFDYADGTYAYSEVIALGMPERTGYVFEGWQISVDGGEFTALQGSYTVGSDLEAERVSIKAVFSGAPHSVTVIGDGVSQTVTLYTDENYYTALKEYESEGFSGWYFDEAFENAIGTKDTVSPDATDSFTVYGSFADKLYTATLIMDGVSTQKQYHYGDSLPTESKTGYTFVAWVEEDGNVVTSMPARTVLFVYQKQGATNMNKMDYEKAITEAKDKGELIGVIIAFSQDTSLPWTTFRKYYNQAHLRMLTEFNEE